MLRVTALLIFVSMFFLASCGEDRDQTIKELRQQIQTERQITEKARQNSAIAQQDAASAKSSLNLLLGIGVAAIVLALLIGVALGSKARNDARNRFE